MTGDFFPHNKWEERKKSEKTKNFKIKKNLNGLK
jgi:hypothetical protein